jgi:sugar phosphate isomerase/epimerase
VERAVIFLQDAQAQLGERFALWNTLTGPLIDATAPAEQCARHGSAIATPEQWNWAVEGYRTIAAAAGALGVRVAFETHMRFLHDQPAATRELVTRIAHPAVAITLDYGNVVYFPQAPSVGETLACVQDHLAYVHVKNSVALPGAGRLAVGLGDGEINHREYLRTLLAQGYRGPICLEAAPRVGDRLWFAQHDLMYCRALLAELAT